MKIKLEDLKHMQGIVETLEEEAKSVPCTLKDLLYRKGLVSWIIFNDNDTIPLSLSNSQAPEDPKFYSPSRIYYDVYEDEIILDINVNKY